ncbi:MAG: hypothetical protein ABI871_05840 [Chthoniobacterales bacterium]
MIETILRDLRQPEYIHTLINPLPIYGLTVALLGLVVALFMRSRRGQIIALVLVFVTASSAWPAAYFGEEAYDRVLSMADETGQAWLEEHARRADDLVLIFYALAAVSAMAIVVPRKWPRTALPLTLATVALALCSLGAGGYIAYAGGKIRHREFRNAAPPPRKAEAEPR